MTWGIQQGAGFDGRSTSPAGTGAQYPGIVFDAEGTPLAEQPAPRDRGALRRRRHAVRRAPA